MIKDLHMSIFEEDFYIIDLTHPIDETVATWEGECGFKDFIDVDYKDHSDHVRLMRYEMFAGIGTHIDSPAFFYEGYKTVIDILPENLFAKACVMDISYKIINNPDYMVSTDDINEWESENGKILPNTLFLFYTGWSLNWADPEKYRNEDEFGQVHFPGVSLEAADDLIDRDVLGIGIDNLSIDGGKVQPEVHKKFLGTGSKYIVENIANLDRLPATGAHVIVAPIKVIGGTEAPVRMFGFVKK
jgi:kynurenine formamidase